MKEILNWVFNGIGILFLLALLVEIGSSPENSAGEKMFFIFLVLIVAYCFFGDSLAKEK